MVAPALARGLLRAWRAAVRPNGGTGTIRPRLAPLDGRRGLRSDFCGRFWQNAMQMVDRLDARSVASVALSEDGSQSHHHQYDGENYKVEGAEYPEDRPYRVPKCWPGILPMLEQIWYQAVERGHSLPCKPEMPPWRNDVISLPAQDRGDCYAAILGNGLTSAQSID